MSAQNVFKSFFRERKQQIDRAQVYKIELIKFLKDNRRELMKQFENTNKELKRFADAPANNNDIAINLDNPKEEALRIDTLNYISNYNDTKPIDCDLKKLFLLLVEMEDLYRKIRLKEFIYKQSQSLYDLIDKFIQEHSLKRKAEQIPCTPKFPLKWFVFVGFVVALASVIFLVIHQNQNQKSKSKKRKSRKSVSGKD